MNEKVYSLKRHLKMVAVRIQHLKSLRKSEPHGLVQGLRDAQFNYRANHIAYCLLRGRTLEQIESSRVKNPPDPTSAEEKELSRQVKHIVDACREEVACVG